MKRNERYLLDYRYLNTLQNRKRKKRRKKLKKKN